MKRISLKEHEAHHLALVKPSALGDVVHSLPVLHALRVRFPDARITWIINRSYESLVRDHPDLSATMPFDRGAGLCTFASLLREIHLQRFDLVIDLQGLLRSGLMAWASGAGRRVGLRSAREGARLFYTDLINDLPIDRLHAVDRYWRVAEALGVGHLEKKFHVPLGAAEQAWAAGQFGHRPRPWIVMNLGTRWETKRWPVEHFAELGRRTLDGFGGTIILVGSADERPLAEHAADLLPGGALDLTGRTDLRHLAAVLAQADVVVSNDSGPLHLAAALGRPVVAPFTCTSPIRTAPYGQAAAAILTQVWCAASYLKHCARMECMKELSPERLWPALASHLKGWARRTA